MFQGCFEFFCELFVGDKNKFNYMCNNLIVGFLNVWLNVRCLLVCCIFDNCLGSCK